MILNQERTGPEGHQRKENGHGRQGKIVFVGSGGVSLIRV